jgi:hypothetical protein
MNEFPTEKLPLKAMRRPTREDFLKTEDAPDERRRFFEGRTVIIKMDEDYDRRLHELKERSKRLNQLLEEKFRARDYPLTTRKTHAALLRLTVNFAPAFFSSNEEKEGRRYNSAPDEVALFLHLNDDDSFDTLRVIARNQTIAFIGLENTAHLINGKNPDDELAAALEAKDDERLADLLTEKFSQTLIFRNLQKIKNCRTLDTARELYRDPEYVNQISPFLEKTFFAVLKSILIEAYKKNPNADAEQITADFMIIPVYREERQPTAIENYFYDADIPDDQAAQLARREPRLKAIAKEARDEAKRQLFAKK